MGPSEAVPAPVVDRMIEDPMARCDAMLSELRGIVAVDVRLTHERLDRMYLGIPEDDPRIEEVDILDWWLRTLEARG